MGFAARMFQKVPHPAQCRPMCCPPAEDRALALDRMVAGAFPHSGGDDAAAELGGEGDAGFISRDDIRGDDSNGGNAHPFRRANY